MHIKKIRMLTEAIYTNDLSTARATLLVLLKDKDEDILVITVRELVNSGILMPGSKVATIIGGIILDAESRRSLLTKFARRLNDPIPSEEYVRWLDSVLARNVRIEIEDFASHWANLDDVIKIRKLIAQVPYSSAIEKRCKPISDDRDHAYRQCRQIHRTGRDTVPPGTENCYDEAGNFIYSDPMPSYGPIIPEEVDDP